MSDVELVDASGWISDESDFYGPDEMREKLERKVQRRLKRQAESPSETSFSTAIAKRVKLGPGANILPTPSPSPETNAKPPVNALDFLKSRPQIAAMQKGHSTDMKAAAAPPEPARNLNGSKTDDMVERKDIFLGCPEGWQRSESVTDFVRRASPAEPASANFGPWLWITAPMQPYSQVNHRKDEDLAAFIEAARGHFDSFRNMRSKIEDANSGKAAGTITRYMRPYREQLEDDILSSAVKHGVTHGKWLLFPSRDTVARTWRLICEAMAQSKLGPTAKVATYEPGNDNPVICVYTYNFADTEDVKRVLKGLEERDLVSRDSSKPLYYKCDAYTHLGLMSGNDYKIKATLYDSTSVLKGEVKANAEGPIVRLRKRNGTIDAFLSS